MFWSVTQTLMSGLATTFEIFILTLVFALPLGLVIAFGLMSKFKPLRYLLEVIVWVIRGTPLMIRYKQNKTFANYNIIVLHSFYLTVK